MFDAARPNATYWISTMFTEFTAATASNAPPFDATTRSLWLPKWTLTLDKDASSAARRNAGNGDPIMFAPVSRTGQTTYERITPKQARLAHLRRKRRKTMGVGLVRRSYGGCPFLCGQAD